MIKLSYSLVRAFTLLMALCLTTLTAQAEPSGPFPVSATPEPLWNVTPDGYLFNGYDVVSVFPATDYPQNRQAKASGEKKGGYIPEPLKGDKAISASYGDFKLAFANEANRQRFMDTPDALKSHFLPKYGGWCAQAMASGYLVPIAPGASAVIPDADGNQVFFTQAATLARKAFIQNLNPNYPNAESHWLTLIGNLEKNGMKAIEEAKSVGIQGNAKAVSNAARSFFQGTPDIEELQLPELTF